MNMIKEFLLSVKDLIWDYIKSRLFPITVLMLVLFSLLVNRLFRLQIVEGEEHVDNFNIKTIKTLTVDSVRGNIYDVNGKLLAYNELSYNVTFGNDNYLPERAESLGMTENELKNQVVYETIQILEENGDELTVDFPIVYENGRYKFTVSNNALNSFLKDVYAKNSYDELTDEQKNQTAEGVVSYLRFGNDKTKNFEISSKYSNEDAMKILACRYKLWLNRYQQYVPVNIAEGISEKSRAAIKENADELLGMDVEVQSVRVYNDPVYFSNIIGYIGPVSPEELETLNNNEELEVPYDSDDVVGKTGIEKVYENELRGTDGEQVMYVDNLGKVLDIISDTPVKAGNDIYLTIDSDLQIYCYDMLEREIASILLANITPKASAPEDNKDNEIPITDVYFALFNNNQIRMNKMTEPDATELEKQVYSKFQNKQQNTLNRLQEILKTERTPLSSLSKEYQTYMEYICEMLSNNGIYDVSKIDRESSTFIKYTSNQISLAEFLEYAISVEAIDIRSIETEGNYFDSDEIYGILCDYILNYLRTDSEFDKQMLKVMVKSGEITGADVVNLLYDQGVFEEEGDREYADFKNGLYNSYEYMIRKITKLEITPAMLALDPCSGAIVVTDVNSGEVRALVSYPGYNNNYLTNKVDPEYYNQLLEDKTSPMYNIACRMRTAPGSTFKIITSIAGVSEGAISVDTKITDKGVFKEVYSQPKCWIYRSSGGYATHGTLGIDQALNNSCNYFYYEVGYRLAQKNNEYSDSTGLNALHKYAEMFGLGEKSGIELDESEPHISDNDAVASAIGQGTHNYTPTQLSRYVTTVANSGTCYDLSLISKVTDYEGNILSSNQHVVHSTVTVDQALWDIVHRGMRLVVSDHLRSTKILSGLKVNVAGKTGTAQENENRPSHALFISYAPYENPEVSVTVVIRNGYSSGNAAELAGFVYAYMYDKDALENATIGGDTQVSD